MLIDIDRICCGYDVVVAGGGPSGCAAAAAAARRGVRTLLLESTQTLGGMGTIGMVNCFAPFGDGEKRISRGIAQEVARRSNAAAYHTETESIGWVASSPEDLKRIYDDLVVSSGADVLFGSFVCGARRGADRIEHALAADKGGLCAYRAKMYVDCTGDGDLAAFAGVPFDKGDDRGNLQPATLCFVLANVGMEAFRAIDIYGGSPGSPIHRILSAGGKYPLIRDTHLCADVLAPGIVSFNAGHLWESDGTRNDQISRSVMRGRELARQFRDALAEAEPEAFGRSYLIQTAQVLGVRETRRIRGEYTLTAEDYLARRAFGDEIARNSYFIDIHPGKDTVDAMTPGEMRDADQKRVFHYQKGESHGIPYRCLIPLGLDNLLVAGRAISCDRTVQGSVRVMPNCLTTGEAAGAAAALAVKGGTGVRGVDANALRESLREGGAYFL